jgi:hypothetical protein
MKRQADSLPVDPRIPAGRPQRRERPGTDLGHREPRYWASLDPGRPGKRQALVLDVGRFVRPLITPDDPDAVKSAIRAQACDSPAISRSVPRVTGSLTVCATLDAATSSDDRFVPD